MNQYIYKNFSDLVDNLRMLNLAVRSSVINKDSYSK